VGGGGSYTSPAGHELKKEARLLLSRATDALILSVDHFNRAWNVGRSEAVLVQLDRGFELFLKAAILHKGGKIRERRARQTIGFALCVRRCVSDASVKCLTPEQALTLQIINGLRDAAQHYILETSEDQLYFVAQAGVTLFRDLLKSVFKQDLASYLPERVLPVSSRPPKDLITLFDEETEVIRKMLKPGSRRRVEARARLRTMAVIEGSVENDPLQPGEGELNRLLKRIAKGEGFKDVFPGLAALRFDTSGTGPTISLRITKTQGIPITLVKEGDAGAVAVAVKRVDELGYYSLGLRELSDKIGVSTNKTLAVVRHLGLQDDPDFFKAIHIGKASFKRYSSKALDHLKKQLPVLNIDQIWAESRMRKRRRTAVPLPT
jgi:hypothetical protein